MIAMTTSYSINVKPPTMRLSKRTRGVVLVFIVFG